MSGETLRLNYFQRQLLGAADFTAEQVYHRSERRRHNLGPHGWGVVTGMTLVEVPREGDTEFVDLVVMPGLAIDLFGREILVLAPAPLDPSLFAALAGDQKREVWIAFDELALQNGQAARMICNGTDQYARIEETYKLFAGPQTSSLWDLGSAGLTAGGGDAVAAPPPPAADPGKLQLPADGALVYQDFEDPGVTKRWLVRLGSARWDGTAGKFRPVAAQTDLVEERTWAGFVGAALLSEAGSLRLGPRAPFADPDAQDFATVEGRLVVAGKLTAQKDVDIDGGKLEFFTTLGTNDNVPLWLQRRSVVATGTEPAAEELHVHVGDDPSAKDARLSIGAGAITDAPALIVRANKNVDANGKLRFVGTAPRQAIDLTVEDDGKDGAYGFGAQNGAAYVRTANEVYWYRGGAHDPAAGTAGTGGSVLLRLDGSGDLWFGAQVRQMLNLWQDKYGIGIQANTLYFRSDDDFAWHRRGSHDDNRGSAGPGGTRMMSLDTNGRLFFSGQTKQMLNLWSSNYGVGVQDGTLYFRTDFDVCWFRGGTHDDTRSSPGAGGALALKLDQFSNLMVTGSASASAFYVGAQRLPILDVQTGVKTINVTPGGGQSTASGQFFIDVDTNLINYTTAQIMVGLSDIANNGPAENARWRVRAPASFSRLSATRARFVVEWQVDDTDGWLNDVSYIAIFQLS